MKTSLSDLIPAAPEPEVTESKIQDWDAHLRKMIDGILANIQVGRYCHNFDFLCEFPDLELEKLVKLFDDKGWSLTYEDLSDLDGTIQFRITSKSR
jgi:hypothetical protein